MASPEVSRGLALRALRSAGRPLARLPRLASCAVALVWMVFIWNLSSHGMRDVPHSLFWRITGNLAHAPLSGILSLWTLLALAPAAPRAPWPRVGRREALLCLVLVALYGVVDEWHQSLTPGRQSSPRDVVTDVVGAACVIWVAAYVTAPRASELGVRVRLALGVVACSAAALLASA